MIADVVDSYLEILDEREFDAPFIALLRAVGFWDSLGEIEFEAWDKERIVELITNLRTLRSVWYQVHKGPSFRS
jgi:hypothetical protein